MNNGVSFLLNPLAALETSARSERVWRTRGEGGKKKVFLSSIPTACNLGLTRVQNYLLCNLVFVLYQIVSSI